LFYTSNPFAYKALLPVFFVVPKLNERLISTGKDNRSESIKRKTTGDYLWHKTKKM
jgi:hypothetical protein